MNDLPILFSAPMVRALLDGRKTKTRRLAWRVKVNPGGHIPDGGGGQMDYVEPHEERTRSPWQRVQPGDRLWVRESAVISPAGFAETSDQTHAGGRVVQYVATHPDTQPARDYGLKVSPSIHMPRWASRLTLIMTATKIERLQDISPDDCLAEGIPPITDEAAWSAPIPKEPNLPAIYIGAFAKLWSEIHGPDAWAANPEVCAISFRVIRQNIDQLERTAA